MLFLGLTGNVACGKSTVAGFLEARGARTIDADLLVRELYADRAFALEVAGLFATPVLAEDGTVDRAKLGRLVFGDVGCLARLEQLVHPEVMRLRVAKIAELSAGPNPPRVVVLEAVKLVESGQNEPCDQVWCVTCAPEVQLKRMVQGRGLSATEAARRLASQPPLEGKWATVGASKLRILENDDGLNQLETRVEALWEQLLRLESGNPVDGGSGPIVH